MSTTATLAYSSFLGGATAAQMIAAMQSVKPPTNVLDRIGVSVVSAAASGTDPVVLTVALSLIPISPASATATLIAKTSTGTGIESVAVGAPGSGYTAPPIVTFTGGRPPTVDNPGFPTTPIVVRNQNYAENTPAQAQAYLKVVAATVGSIGSGYSANAKAVVSGRKRQGGTDAKLALTVGGGTITGVAISDPGSGYTEVPVVTVVDTTGSGATITLSMGVGEVIVERAGGGFDSVPTVVLTPLFLNLFPDGTDQKAPFQQLMTTALEQATMGPVSAGPPIIA